MSKARNKWTLEKIKKGFNLFFEEHKKLPIAPEVDKLSYLPSSRTIQRSFEGLEQIRKKLGYEDTNFGKGKYRSKISAKASSGGLNAERVIEKLLVDKFGEPFVHVEKRVENKKNRLDFFIYSPTNNFGIDVFSTNSFHNLQKNVNVKIGKFVNINCEMIYLVGLKIFNQEKIDSWVKNKRKLMPKNSSVMNIETFLKYISSFDSYYL